MDDFNREVLAIDINSGITTQRAIHTLDLIAAWRGPALLEWITVLNLYRPLLLSGRKRKVLKTISSSSASLIKMDLSNGLIVHIEKNC